MMQAAMAGPHDGGRAASPWRGHHPDTRRALEGILQRAVSGRAQATLQERVLYTICEFRAIAADGRLRDYLASGALHKLADARFALNEIGAVDIAASLSETIEGIRRTKSERRVSRVLGRLQSLLHDAGAALDERIARYARNIRVDEDAAARMPR